jgi:hypothetical protein
MFLRVRNKQTLKKWTGIYAKGTPGENPVCTKWIENTSVVQLFINDILGSAAVLLPSLNEEQIKMLARSIVDKLIILGKHQMREELLPKELWDTESYRFLLTITPAIGRDYFDSFPQLQDTKEYQDQFEWWMEYSPTF